jgi:hypothetical protein
LLPGDELLENQPIEDFAKFFQILLAAGHQLITIWGISQVGLGDWATPKPEYLRDNFKVPLGDWATPGGTVFFHHYDWYTPGSQHAVTRRLVHE